MRQRMSLTIVVVILSALCLTNAAVFRVIPTVVLNSGTTYDFIFSNVTMIDITPVRKRMVPPYIFPLKTDDLI